MKTTESIDQITLKEYIARHGVTMRVEAASNNPHMISDTPMDHWYCTLRNSAGDMMGVHFSTGTGLRKVPDGVKVSDYEQWAIRNYGLSHKSTQNPRKLRTEYETYSRLKQLPVAPDAESVLDCLASDAASIENSPDFENWCAEFGYDTDSRKAYKTFQACSSQAAQLKAWAGESYETLLWNTERL